MMTRDSNSDWQTDELYERVKEFGIRLEAWEIIQVERVHKTNKTTRYKRDAEKYAEFPSTLMYDLLMKELRIPLRLRKHHTSSPALTITSAGGKTYQYDRSNMPKTNYGIYTDPVTSAIIAVSFDDITGESRLYGNFYLHDENWHISPADINNPHMSHVVEKLETSGIRKAPTKLSKAAVPQQGMGGVSVDQVSSRLLKEMGLNVPHGRQSKRHKRQVPSGCNVIETAVIVDETVLAFHLNLTGGDFNAAVMSINMYYSVIFTEVDLRYCELLDIECIRVYLSEVIIPEPNAPVWTGDQVRPDGSIDENTLFHACRLAARDANYTRGNDYILCATRRDLFVENDPEYRVFGYLKFLCAPNPSGFNSGIFEDRLDDVSLLIAHVIAFGFGVENDDVEGCNNEDNFLMSRFNRVPFDPATITNPWNISNCTTSEIVERITNFTILNANCLIDNDFTDTEFNARLVDQPLAGEIYDVDFQCAYRFGIGTTACIGPDETSITNVDDLCHIGVFCNVSGECSNSTRSRVLNGTPCGQDKICFKNLCEDVPGHSADLCEECTNTTECPENATCNPVRNICLCIEGFSTNECGVCVENRDLGENCSDGVDCADECAVCDPKDKVCVCFKDKFDNNTMQMVGGVCLPKVNNTEMCPQEDACLDNNAFCNAMNMCECKPNFVLDGNNVCVPVTIPSVICQPCFNDSNCTIANTECVEVDGSKICKCKSGFFLNMCGICTEKPPLGGNCSGDTICADPNAVCSPDDICVCFEDNYDNNTAAIPDGTCLPRIPTGDPCPPDNTDHVCLDENAICNGTICVCRDGFKLNASGICVPLRDLCESCVDDSDCGGDFTECIDDGMGMGKICRCVPTHSVNKCGECIENRPLGSNCSDEVKCADPNAVCSPNETCVCFGDTYDNNTGAVSGGICLSKIPTGDPCPSDNTDDVCLDENAMCNGTICVCRDGFKSNASGICVPLLGLCELCNDNHDCGGEFTECIDDGMGMGKICRCMQTHFVNKCGVCIEKPPLGGNCSGDAICADPNAVCTPGGICVCFEDTYDNNTSGMPGGTCLPKIPTGDPCPPDNTDDVCEDDNAVCNGTICVCRDGFKLNASGICVPLLGLCEPCVDSHDCGGEFTECIDDGMGMGQICRCMQTHFVNKCGVCTEKPPLGGNCSGEAICADPNAVCTPDDICVCFGDTYDNNTSGTPGGTCLPKIPTGDPCPPENTDHVCRDENAMCNGTVCVCNEGFKLNASDICVPLLGPCEPCTDSNDCAGDFTECIDDGKGMGQVCRCVQTHFLNECGECQEKPPLGGNCSGEAICADPNAVCTPGDICVCFEDTYDNNTSGTPGGTCLPKIPTGDPCPPENTDHVCRDENAMCNGTVCVCNEGFKLNASDICVPLLGPCEPCTDSHDCAGDFTECIDDGKGMGQVCRCVQTHFLNKCGECQEKPPLGGNCSGEAICADPNAVCTPGDICVCFEDTYDNNTSGTPGGTCLPKIPTGDPCPPENTDHVCRDENAMCNGTVCVCNEGFKLNASDICVPLLGPCEPCTDSHDCAGDFTECIDDGKGMGQVCRCVQTHFLNKCGECQEKPPLGGNCSGEAICADPNAVCTPGDICVCFEDTYDNNTSGTPGGTCLPKIPTGDPCPPENTDHVCRDENAMCNGTVCVCNEGFKLNASDICVPLLGPCEPCTDSHDCAGDFTECIDDGKGMGQVCRCVQTHFLNKCGECQEKIPLSGNCSHNAMCNDANAVCFNDICVCFGETYDDNGVDTLGGTCIPKEANGDPCNQTDACLDVNAECNGTTCVCKEGFVLSASNVCVPANGTTPDPETGLCDPCEDDGDCDVNNTFCKDLGGTKECRCMEGFFVNKCGECETDVELGGNCTDNKQCADPNAVCGPDDICVCFNDTYDSNGSHPGGMCVPKEPNGDPCNQTDACLDVNAACINNVCTCLDGFVLNAMNICVPRNDTTLCPQELCSACIDDANCTLPNTTCDQSTGECRCKDGFFVDVCGDCRPKVGLGSNCSMDSMCLDPQAVCDPESEECVCFGDFYDDNFCTVPGGTCDEKKEVGEICVLPNSCLDPNANCSLTSRCKCNPGFFANDNLQCVPRLPPGSPCDDDDQCVENIECDDEDHECVCPEEPER